ncbi:hypothetical protein AMR41_09045 [Hapalosiphon sp. MRB220]|nr:hypothetical protein AMR41_09045 [Hapalosiphon sp. MRB220]
MISQRLQTAPFPEVVSQQGMSGGDAQRAIAELQDFLGLCPDAREVSKALAVKLVYQGYLMKSKQLYYSCFGLYLSSLCSA